MNDKQKTHQHTLDHVYDLSHIPSNHSITTQQDQLPKTKEPDYEKLNNMFGLKEDRPDIGSPYEVPTK